MSISVHATCFDASALAKRWVDEQGSDVLRQYWRTQATRYTTPFCLYETLGILKRRRLRKHLSMEEYLRAATELVFWFRASDSRMEDPDFTRPDVFNRARTVAVQFDIDLSDAFQLLSLDEGYFSGLVGESSTVLVTADASLANAARSLGLAVWDCMREPMPTR